MAHAREALALSAEGREDDHPAVLRDRYALCRALLAAGRPPEARPLCESALEAAVKTHGEDHAYTSLIRVALARVLLAQGRAEQAVPLLQSAERVLANRSGGAVDLSEARFALARALLESGGDPSCASRLASQARDTYRRLGSKDTRPLDEVEAWLAANGGATTRGAGI